MKLNLQTVTIIVLVLGLATAIVYANSMGSGVNQRRTTDQDIASNDNSIPLTTPSALELTVDSDADEILSDDELRAKVLPDNDLLLPDLVLADPRRVVIRYSPTVKELLFDTAFANLGEGDLHLYSTEEEDRFLATQILTSQSGDEYHTSVGDFQYKDEHDHWHLANFANYELWGTDEFGVRDELAASSVKVSFCIWDYGVLSEGNFNLIEQEFKPQDRQYPECNYDQQGLTVGWYDLYDPFTPGQSINILEVPDGIYILRTIINVNQEVFEISYDNNESSIYIEIIGNAAKILNRSDAIFSILRED